MRSAGGSLRRRGSVRRRGLVAGISARGAATPAVTGMDRL